MSSVQVRAGSYEEGGTLVVTKSLFIIKDPSQADDEVVNLMCSIVFYGDKVPSSGSSRDASEVCGAGAVEWAYSIPSSGSASQLEAEDWAAGD